MRSLIIPLIALVGVLNAVQAGPNTELSKRAGQPIAASVLVSIVSVGALLLVSPVFGLRVSALREAMGAPWWAWLGGLLGISYVLTMVYATPKVGAGTFTGITVTAGIVAAVVIDHFGWLGVQQHTAGGLRALGCAIMIVGVLLVALF